MNIEKRIQLCKNFTPIEIQISHYILNHKDMILNMTIEDFSKEIFTSKSTIHRFCKKINLNGFNDLKVELAKNQHHSFKHEQVDVNYPFKINDTTKDISLKLTQIYELAIKDTFEVIDQNELYKISKLLHQAQLIDIYTSSHNSHVAYNFQDKMLSIGRIVNCPQSEHMNYIALASNEKHVAIIISYSGKATYIPTIIEILSKRKTPIILISKIGNNFYPQYITYHLGMSDQENVRDHTSEFASHIALQYMLDVIFACVYHLDLDKNNKYLKEYIHYTDDRNLDE